MADHVHEEDAAAPACRAWSGLWMGAGTLLAGTAAFWLWSRWSEPALRERTRQRLAPRGGPEDSDEDLGIGG